MASHHHQHPCSCRHNHHHNIPQVATFRDSPPCCHPSPPPPQENLLHLLSSYLQTQQKGTNFPDQTCSCNHKNVPRDPNHALLSSLLRKIDNLESSLNKFPYSTLRDSAARVIQTHFRSYLVYRSVSFRHLKELAMIKSSFLSLKSSVSGKPIFPYKVVSRKATDLLLRVDSIQGRIDPMIRSSKRSLSRDLVRFLQYVDDCVVRKYGYVSKNVSFVGSHSKKPQAFGVAEDRRVYVTCDGDKELDSTTDDSEEVSIDKRKTGSRSKLRTGATVKGNNVVKPPLRKIMVPDGSEELDSATDDSEEVSVDKRRTGSSKLRTGAIVKGNNVVKPPVRRIMVPDGSEELDSATDDSEEVYIDKRKASSSKLRTEAIVKGNNVVKPPVRKTDKNRNVYEVYGNKHDVTSSAEDDSVDSEEEETHVVSKDHGRRLGLKTRNMVLVKGGGGGKDRVVKTVSFDENGNVYKVYGDTPEESISEGDDSTSDGNGEKKGNGNEDEEIKYVPKENEGFEEDEEEEIHSENEVSSSDGSEGDARDAINPGSNEGKRRDLMFSPPLPLKMEP